MNHRVWLCALPFLPLTAAGHHSVAEYDLAAMTELEGEIVAVLWRNPHVVLTLRTAGVDGAEEWQLEAENVNLLGRQGVRADMIRTGDRVMVAGNASRARQRALYVTNVLLPNGTEIRMRGANTAPRWSTTTAGFQPLSRAVAGVAGSARGLFRVWLNEGGPVRLPPSLPLTPGARAASEQWNPTDDLVLKCVAPGMPMATIASGPAPIDLAERDGDIVIRTESFDVVRIVHLKTAADPALQPATPLGYSVGRWDGDALVVRTTRISWPYIDRNGRIPQSEAVVVDERFSIEAATDRLVYELTVTDPATLTEAVTLRALYAWHPELAVEPYECTLRE
jgi:hypothetical protein